MNKARNQLYFCAEAVPENRKHEMIGALRSSARCRLPSTNMAHYPCTVTPADLEWPERCPILGVSLKYDYGYHGPDKATFDRVNSSLGYIPGNVRIISFRANALKGSIDLRTAENIVKYMRAPK